MIIRSAFASIAVLLLIAGMALAQQPVNERLGRLEERLETIQQNQEAILDRFGEMGRRLEGLDQKVGSRGGSGSEVAAVAEIARQTMASYESQFSLIKWVSLGASALITIILTGFAILGYREIRNVTKPLIEKHNELAEDHKTIMVELKEAEKKYSTLNEDLVTLKNEAQANLRGSVFISGASTFIGMYVSTGETNEVLLRRAARDVERTIESIKPTDPKILGWAYALNGYILRRTSTLQSALESLEISLKLDPESSEATWYNAGCYAALLGEKEKWIRYLGEAIKRYPGLKEVARSDSDFGSVQDDPEFKRLTGQA